VLLWAKNECLQKKKLHVSDVYTWLARLCGPRGTRGPSFMRGNVGVLEICRRQVEEWNGWNWLDGMCDTIVEPEPQLCISQCMKGCTLTVTRGLLYSTGCSYTHMRQLSTVRNGALCELGCVQGAHAYVGACQHSTVCRAVLTCKQLGFVHTTHAYVPTQHSVEWCAV